VAVVVLVVGAAGVRTDGRTTVVLERALPLEVAVDAA
jgi:hypothetical protein